MIFAGFCDENFYLLPDALSVEVNRELSVAADDMAVIFPWCEGFPNLWRIYAVGDGCVDVKKAVENGEVLFGGIVDEQIYTCDNTGERVKINSRSMAALLLDNECPPMKYINPTAEVLCKNHIAPFGISCDCKSNTPKNGELSIVRGSSHYEVLLSFCRDFLDSTPCVEPNGSFKFDALRDKERVLFDNSSGIGFESVIVCDNRYKRLSKIYVTNESGGKTTLNNFEAQRLGIVRERYISLALSKTHTLSDADRAMASSEGQSFWVTLVCCGCLTDKLGCFAEVNIDACRGKELVVSKVKYYAKNGNEYSQLKLTLHSDLLM